MAEDYIVHHTDINVPNVTVPAMRQDATSFDVALFGGLRLEYGEALNEDLLNILENFACPEEAGATSFIDAVPDLAEVSKTQLTNPTPGQFWYNSTRSILYTWSGTTWIPLNNRGNYGANWGQVYHGQQLPRPLNALGQPYPYAECIWAVAPAVFTGKIGFMNCTTDANATVTMQYRLSGSSQMLDGQVNYLIVGISGNTNNGQYGTPPAPTPTPTMSGTPTPTPTPSVTLSPEPTPSATPTQTPPVSPTPTPTVSLSRTPAASVTPTPAPTGTPTRTPSPSLTRTPSPSLTPTPTPSETPFAGIPLCDCEGAWFAGSGYLPSHGNYLTYNACLANKPAGASWECQIGGPSCWQLINRNDAFSQVCLLFP